MRRGRPDPDGGETVVRAVVHARLLGLRILSLEARVVLGPAPGPLSVYDADAPVPVAVPGRPIPAQGSGVSPRLGRAAAAADLSRAVELLAHGAETLERSRSLTHRTSASR